MVIKSLKAGCLPHAVGKQPSMPLIDLERTWMLNDDDDDDDDDDDKIGCSNVLFLVGFE